MSYHGVSEETADRVADLMEKVGKDRWQELEQRLVAGTMRELDDRLRLARLGRCEMKEVMLAATVVYEQGQGILRTRKELHQSIIDAQQAIQRARKAMKDLWSVWGDAEYEGDNADVEHFLSDAARSLRAAQALKPTDRNGE